MAVEERHPPATAGDGIAVAREEGEGSSLDLERVLDTNRPATTHSAEWNAR